MFSLLFLFNLISKQIQNKLNSWFRMGTNHLEQYLEDVYEKECTFKGDKQEVEFIKKGIETFVQKIVDKILESDSVNEKFRDILTRNVDAANKDFHDSIEELYVPVQIGTENETVQYKYMPVVKVGSVYEGTKNGFPDEFDFIFLLFCGKADLLSPSVSSLDDAAFKSLKTIITNKDVPLSQTFPCGKGKLSFVSEKQTEVHGPAAILKFIYKNCSGDEKPIHVDLVPAHKMIVGNKNCKWFIEYVYEHLKQKSFNKCVLKAESCLNVRGNVSFTETEVHFIGNVLSEEHVIVYRILKFLINGHHGGEDLKQAFKNQDRDHRFKIYSSYNIKTMMIQHHDECTNTDKTNIGPCVIQVLEEIYKYQYANNFPNCSYEGDESIEFYLIKELSSLIAKFKYMEVLEGNYDYEKHKEKSLSLQGYKRFIKSIPKKDRMKEKYIILN